MSRTFTRAVHAGNATQSTLRNLTPEVIRYPMKITRAVFAVLVCWLAYPFAAPAAGQEPPDFAHDILPVLKDRCARCHANGNAKGDFSIDTRESILDSGAVDPDAAADSELLLRISAEDDDYRMPPDGPPLTGRQIELFRKWIVADLPWQPGFSFRDSTWQAPIAFREVALPAGDGHPIDRLLAEYFQRNGIQPPRPVTDTVFIRRVWLDLIGTLPTLAEQNAFANDPDPRKREKRVADLLARNRDYADHWMTFWNDLLRNDYEGTGYIDGGRKPITRWLHRSLYDNKPYDQFVRELIHPDSESDGFVRGIRWRGNVNASQRVELQFSQNVSQVFLGENLKCASCHDSFVNNWKLADAWSMAAVISDQPLEMVRCDHPTGNMAEPGFLWPELGTIPAGAPPDERLAELAQLITGPQNGRFARTVANRIWQRMLGRGMIEPVDVMANEPFDAGLIDFLACYLRDHHYDLKQLLALIATSQAYQGATVTESESPVTGPLFRGPVLKRLTAEQFCDALWSLTGTSPETGNAKIDESTASASTVRAGLVVSTELMRDLGRPNREQVVTTRGDQLSTLQALSLSNGQPLFEMLRAGGRKWLAEHPDRDQLIDELFRSALCRSPTDPEWPVLREIAGPRPDQDSVADLIWSIVLLPEFQYVH